MWGILIAGPTAKVRTVALSEALLHRTIRELDNGVAYLTDGGPPLDDPRKR